MYLVDQILSENPYNFTIGTPQENKRRGGNVAIEHEEGMRISEALRARGVISDFRPPNVMRIAPIPLYNTYSEAWKVIQHLREMK